MGRSQVGSTLAARILLLRTGEAVTSPKGGARHGAQDIVTIDDPMVNGLPPPPSQWSGTYGLGLPCWCQRPDRAVFRTTSCTRICPKRSSGVGGAITSMTGCPCKRKFIWIRWCTPVLEFKSCFEDCLCCCVALPLHPETVLPGWGTWKDPRV